MTHLTAIGTVIVEVPDQDAALAFHVDQLGFEVRLDGPSPAGRWIEVAPPGARTSIALVGPQPDGAVISLATDDADAAHAELRQRGVDVDEQVLRFGEGVPPMFSFRDASGATVRVVERPA